MYSHTLTHKNNLINHDLRTETRPCRIYTQNWFDKWDLLTYWPEQFQGFLTPKTTGSQFGIQNGHLCQREWGPHVLPISSIYLENQPIITPVRQLRLQLSNLMQWGQQLQLRVSSELLNLACITQESLVQFGTDYIEWNPRKSNSDAFGTVRICLQINLRGFF